MATTEEYLSDSALGLVREVRQSQLQMALSVEEVVRDGGIYFAEGPVGVGKTYAYLVPGLLAGKRVVVSTPKKALQDQIVKKDLPTICEKLGIKPNFVVLKGKSNYACKLLAEPHHPNSMYRDFLRFSKYGDKSDFDGTLPVWFNKAVADSCVGPKCQYASECGFIKLKKDLKDAKVVVINHSLLGADFYYGIGTMTGGPYEVLVIDEAHKLEEGVRSAFTLTITEKSAHEVIGFLHDSPFHFTYLLKLGSLWDSLFETVQNKHWKEPHTREYPVFGQPEVDAVIRQLEKIRQEITDIVGEESDGGALDPGTTIPLVRSRQRISDIMRAVKTFQGQVVPDETLLNDAIMANTVLYGQGTGGHLSLFAAPISLASMLRENLKTIPAVVLTSATLAVDQRFDHLTRITGVEPSSSSILATSFDYAKQGVLYVPKHIEYTTRPKKGDQDHTDRYNNYIQLLIEECAFLCNAAEGNAFILTTANDEMTRIYQGLQKACPNLRILMQTVRVPGLPPIGDGDPTSLLKQYMETDHSVLLGSKSFWEGVDVQGEKLRLVIIPKLPFPSVTDPVIDAKRKRYTERMIAFHQIDYVDMFTDLRQGVGRLIRSVNDRGVAAILDNRVWTKPYGGSVRRGLPFPVTATTWQREHIARYLPMVAKHFDRLRGE